MFQVWGAGLSCLAQPGAKYQTHFGLIPGRKRNHRCDGRPYPWRRMCASNSGMRLPRPLPGGCLIESVTLQVWKCLFPLLLGPGLLTCGSCFQVQAVALRISFLRTDIQILTSVLFLLKSELLHGEKFRHHR